MVDTDSGSDAQPVVVETHVSVLVFHDDVVLKYKKPVRFPFVDLTTRQARHDCCRAEVAVNRRFSPDVYLGVADVVLDGRVLDHAVVMRRLPAERSLAALVAADDPSLGEAVRAVAVALEGCHRMAPRSPAIGEAGRAEAVARTWKGCLDTLASWAGSAVPAELLDEVDRLARRYLAGRAPLFEERVAAGRVCDGHGDLLATDVFVLADGPRLLDAVEFDERLRHVDVVADVAFLAMDLEHRGRADLACELWTAYQEAAKDRFPPSLVHHYTALRATIRAEVAYLRAAQIGVGAAAGGAGVADDPGGSAAAGAIADAVAHLELAVTHLRSGRVVLGVVQGLPGTGKSTLARHVADRLGWPTVRSDDVRAELYGTGRRPPGAVAFGGDGYDATATEHTYTTLLERAASMLVHGQSVLLDATFADRRWQRAAEALAADTSSDLAVLRCTAPADVAERRLWDRARRPSRFDLSDADVDVARAMAAVAERWPVAIDVRTDRPSADVTADACAVLAATGASVPAVVRPAVR